MTSHSDGTLATATFSNVRSGQLPEWVGPRAIGSNTASAVYDGTEYALTARGPDIWGVGDAFAYLWTCTAACQGLDDQRPRPQHRQYQRLGQVRRHVP